LLAIATNDDGIDSPGLRLMVHALRGAGFRVKVAAPLHDMSGAGKSIGFPIRVHHVDMEGAEEALAAEGPPASIVYTALRLSQERPVLVASGVNHGPNLGAEDLLTSATIGAALEAAFQGVPGLAVSVWSRRRAPLPGDEAGLVERVIAEAAAEIARSGAGVRVAIAVNIPPSPSGAVVARPAFNRYDVELSLRDGLLVPVMREDRIYSNSSPPEGTDLWAYRRGLITVVPLGVDPPLCAGEEGWRLAGRIADRLGGLV